MHNYKFDLDCGKFIEKEEKVNLKKYKVIAAFFVVVLIYFLSYIGLRQTHKEIWEKDGNAYVIFPENNLSVYYIFRPLSYLDNRITGMRFHIGQHR